VGVVTGFSQLAYFGAVASAGIAVPTLISNGLGPILTALGQTVIVAVATRANDVDSSLSSSGRRA
jgi:hypothetical protein